MREEIDAGIVRLRRTRIEDAEPDFEAVAESKAEIAQWLPWCHDDYSLDEARRWVESTLDAWARGHSYAFMIEDKAAGRILGAISINQVDKANRSANMGYWIRTSATGKGVATAAARALSRWAFEDLGLMRVEILVAGGNVPSMRVAEKAGAVREGTLRNRFFLQGRPRDGVLYSLVPEDIIP